MKGRGGALVALAVLTLASVTWAQMGGASRPEPVPIAELGRRAETEGLKGTMHGANHRLGTYVFTWWDPRSFFMSVNMSVAPANPEAEKALAQVERHQEVVVHGKLVPNPSAQPHLLVDRVEPGKKWSPGVEVTEPARKPGQVARYIRGRKELDALVHAISEDGSMLVVEVRDEVVPVQVPADAALRETVKGLYRGDRIRFRFRRAAQPERPLHLVLAPSTGGEPALRVTDSARALHEQTRTVEGALVLFPRSPVLRRSIWGVEDRDPKGLHRYYTIFNFQNREDQARIEERLQKAWSGTPGARDARNKVRPHAGPRAGDGKGQQPRGQPGEPHPRDHGRSGGGAGMTSAARGGRGTPL